MCVFVYVCIYLSLARSRAAGTFACSPALSRCVHRLSIVVVIVADAVVIVVVLGKLGVPVTVHAKAISGGHWQQQRHLIK